MSLPAKSLKIGSLVEGELSVDFSESRAAWASFGVAMVAALICGLSAVHHLSWPAESDQFRDLGTTNAFLDGNWWGDHTLAGEVRWYPPLLPALMALLCKATGLSTHLAYAQAGPWLNLLGPLFFFLVVRRWLGPLAALAAMFGMLFFGSNGLAAWKHATYSAWLWPCEFAQGAFFATLAAHPGLSAAEDAVTAPVRRWRSAGTGALLGLTFLTHPAPAMILAGGFFSYAAVCAVLSRGASRDRWIELSIIAAVALAVVLPFLAPLYRAYHFKTLNPDPARRVGLGLTEIVRDLATFRVAVGALGIWAAWRSRHSDRPTARTLLMAGVAATAAVLFLYGLAAQVLEPRHLILPEVTPGFHFHIYVDAFLLMAFGVGFVALARQVAAWARGLGLPFATDGLVALVGLLALTTLRMPAHLAGRDLSTYRQDALGFSNDPAIHELYDWLRANTRPGAVVLCDDGLSIYTVAPAGRAVVSMPENYSNPYVARAQRAGDRDRLYQALRGGDGAAFAALAARYGVGYVTFHDPPPDLARFNLKYVGRFGSVQLARWVAPSGSLASAEQTGG